MKNMDFLEIQNMYGFDQQKAHEAAKDYAPWMAEAVEEALNDVGLETISDKPLSEIRW